MSLKTLLKRGASMNICHLYHGQKDDKILIDILKYFDNPVSFDIMQTQTLDSYNVYIVEIFSVDEKISAQLKKLFAPRSHPCIYFYIPNKYTIALFQLALLLKVKGYITASNDVSTTVKKI